MRWPATLVWLGSIAAALAAEGIGVTLTTVPMIDATILATIAYLTVIRFYPGTAIDSDSQ